MWLPASPVLRRGGFLRNDRKVSRRRGGTDLEPLIDRLSEQVPRAADRFGRWLRSRELSCSRPGKLWARNDDCRSER